MAARRTTPAAVFFRVPPVHQLQFGAIIGTVDLIDCIPHSNISTPQRYIHLDDRDLADAQDLIN
jgi:hypothetical protein